MRAACPARRRQRAGRHPQHSRAARAPRSHPSWPYAKVSLDAPTRHPIDWRHPDYTADEPVYAEMQRVFDICHGCRRCVSLCNAFPTLFDLVDDNPTMEVEGVAKQDYWKVVDQCYLCDLCYMTKCPYVPPHPWNVDFPHLMLRGKAKKFRDEGARFRDRMLTSTDRMGRLASIPVVVKMVNAVNANPAARKAMEKVLGVASQARLPAYDSAHFRDTAERSLAWPLRNGERTPGKVAIFATCYVNYNDGRASGMTWCACSCATRCVPVAREGPAAHAEARARRPRVGRAAEGHRHPAARGVRA